MSNGNLRRLRTMVVMRLVVLFPTLAALLLLPAGTWAYWQAWLYLAVLFGAMTLVFRHLLRHDPALLERRMRVRERAAEQRMVVWWGSVSYLLIFLLPGLDRRLGWSAVPAAAVVGADIMVLLGYALFVRVLRENSYASRVIEVAAGQTVISTGPYARIRHPMYAAVLVMFTATPIALGSWWALAPVLLLLVVLVVRIHHEEALLLRELPGYAAYVAATPYRLLPGVW